MLIRLMFTRDQPFILLNSDTGTTRLAVQGELSPAYKSKNPGEIEHFDSIVEDNYLYTVPLRKTRDLTLDDLAEAVHQLNIFNPSGDYHLLITSRTLSDISRARNG